MGGIAFRSLVLLCIIGIAVAIGLWSYQNIMDLLALQLTLFERILQGKQQLAQGQQELQGLVDTALEFLGKDNTDPSNSGTLPENITSTIASRKKKMHTIAVFISAIIGVASGKILFDIVFSIKKSIQNIKEFIF